MAVKEDNTVEPTTDTTSPVDENQTTPPAEEQPTEPTTKEDDTTQEPSDSEDKAEDTDGGVKPKSVNRFQELANTVKEKALEAERLRQENERLRQQVLGSQPPAPNTVIDPNREYTVEELNQMLVQAQQQGTAQAQLAVEELRREIQQKEQLRDFQTTLERDADYLQSTYPELNENSERYNPALHKELTEMWQELAIKPDGTVDPTVSLRAVGERFMRGTGLAAAEASANTGEAVSRQASASMRSEGAPNQDNTIGPEWFANEYDPTNPEHRKIADEYIARRQNQQ